VVILDDDEIGDLVGVPKTLAPGHVNWPSRGKE